MKDTSKAFFLAVLGVAVLLLSAFSAFAQGSSFKSSEPVLVTSCGQSPGAFSLTVLAKRAQIAHDYKADATVKDLAGGKYKTLVIVTGASLKGMGAAGVSMKDELARTAALIAEAKKQGITVIGAHIEGMARRAQGAAPGDNSDELSIDAVCPVAHAMVVRKDGDEDARFTTIAKEKNIPLLLFDKNQELQGLLKELFGK
jgi:hypothetical protein